MILAGGMSTRLYPLTKQVPKPLVPVAGEPITAHIMRWLRIVRLTRDRRSTCTIFHADQILDAFGDGSRYGVRLDYLHEARADGQRRRGQADGGVLRRHVRRRRLRRPDRRRSRRAGRLPQRARRAGDDRARRSRRGRPVRRRDHRRARTHRRVSGEARPRGRSARSSSTPASTSSSRRFSTTFRPATFYDFGKGVFPALLAAGADFYGLRLTTRTGATSARRRSIARRPTTSSPGACALRGARAERRSRATCAWATTFASTATCGWAQRAGRRRRAHRRTDGHRRRRPHRRRSGHRAFDRVGRGDASARARSCIDSIVGIDYDVPADTTLIDRIVANEPIAT